MTRRTSARVLGFGLDPDQTISRSTYSLSLMSVTLMTSMSLCSCLVICSMMALSTPGDQGQAGDAGVEGFRDAEAFDVEASAAEETGDP